MRTLRERLEEAVREAIRAVKPDLMPGQIDPIIRQHITPLLDELVSNGSGTVPTTRKPGWG